MAKGIFLNLESGAVVSMMDFWYLRNSPEFQSARRIGGDEWVVTLAQQSGTCVMQGAFGEVMAAAADRLREAHTSRASRARRY